MKQCFYIYVVALFCGLTFSQVTHGSMEITGYGGGNFSDDLKLSEVVDKDDQKARTWIFGGDVVYRLPQFDSQKCGIGLRWQHNTIWGAKYEANGAETGQTLNFNANRVALLGSYRFIGGDMGLFLGVIGAVDIWRSMTAQADDPSTEGASETDSRRFDVKSQKWLGTGQLGLEFGFKWTRFFVKGEAGYSYYGFNDLECSGCTVGDNNPTLDLKSIYATLGIGWFFI